MTTETTPMVINWGKYETPEKKHGLYNDWACGSCGCRLVKPSIEPDLPISKYGITIYPGKHGDELVNDEREIVHVETSAGFITLNLRYAKF